VLVSQNELQQFIEVQVGEYLPAVRKSNNYISEAFLTV
jgi:hypothetical protein